MSGDATQSTTLENEIKVTFETFVHAMREGYMVCDRFPDGTFLVRRPCVDGWTHGIISNPIL